MTRVWFPIILAVTLFFSLYSPSGGITGTPKFWRDEAIPFEIARTFVETAKLDISIAPDMVEERSYLTHATGFSVTLPLAGFFALFGIGVLQSRIFMIFWIAASVVALFFVLRSFFGARAAFSGTLLVATFSSFFANGRTTTGEIPGFFFLILALYFIYKRSQFFIGGFFLALAIVTKPSMYLLLIPAIALEFLLGPFFKDRTLSLLKIAVGTLPVLTLWLFIIVPQPLDMLSFQEMIALYQSPFNEPSLLSRFPGALFDFLTHTSVIYFAFITTILVVASWKGAFRGETKRLLHFIFLYGIFALVYFLRSPGWFRFLLAFQLLAFAMLYPALDFLAKRKQLVFGAIFLLVVANTINFFFFSDIPSGRASIETAEFINNEILANDKDAAIGLIYMTTVAPLIASDRKYQIGEIGGGEFYGKHPLSYIPEKLPRYVVSSNNEYKGYEERFKQFYDDNAVATIHGYKIFKKR